LNVVRSAEHADVTAFRRIRYDNRVIDEFKKRCTRLARLLD